MLHRRAFLIVQVIKNLPAIQETQEMQVQSLDPEDPLEEEMATHSIILDWKIPWTENLAGYSPWNSSVTLNSIPLFRSTIICLFTNLLKDILIVSSF